MAKTAVATPSVDFEAIDRLEQKLKMLVTVLDRTRAESARVTDELLKRQIIVDYRPNAGIRIAPHFYTTDDEIDNAIATIDELVKG